MRAYIKYTRRSVRKLWSPFILIFCVVAAAAKEDDIIIKML